MSGGLNPGVPTLPSVTDIERMVLAKFYLWLEANLTEEQMVAFKLRFLGE